MRICQFDLMPCSKRSLTAVTDEGDIAVFVDVTEETVRPAIAFRPRYPAQKPYIVSRNSQVCDTKLSKQNIYRKKNTTSIFLLYM